MYLYNKKKIRNDFQHRGELLTRCEYVPLPNLT